MTQTTEKTAIELISANIAHAKFENLSEWNVQCTKDRLLDICGCIIGGATAEGNKALAGIIKDNGGKAEAPVFIHGGRAPLGDAAMINCISARSNDFGAMFANLDGMRIPSHHSETTIPMALTYSDVFNASGKEFIIAELLGNDTANRVLAAAGQDFSHGWDGTMTLPMFGAVPIASRFMGLTPEQIKDAFGISINMIAGSIQCIYDYSITFKFGQGFSAKNGTFAAQLAKAGWNGIEDALLGGMAYYAIYRRTNDIKNPDILTKDLGKKFFMEESFKRFPCGIPNSPFVVAGVEMNKKHGIKAADIESVELGLSPNGIGMYYDKPFRVGRSPQVNGIFSFQYTAVSALLRGRLKVQDFAVEAVTDPEILETIAKSTIVRDPELLGDNPKTLGMIRLRVTTKSGAVYENVQNALMVTHQYPTKEELLSKFWDQVHAFGNVRDVEAQKLVELIDRLEYIENMKEITELLMPI